MIENVITYEQPLNELIRVCLRLEQLFFQVDHQVRDTSIFGTRSIIALIIDILQLLERPDLKAKLAKELTHQMQLLAKLEKTPEIDHVKLSNLLKQLDELGRWLIESSGRLGQHLREIELLNTLRLHLATPGGGCNFDIPVYHYWLQQPAEKRLETVKSWLAEFNKIRLTNDLILKLVREESKTQQKTASNGFHQELLDPQTNLRLIRVMVPKDIVAYPEISLGRHFLSIRFYAPTIQERAAQYQHNISFWLTYCTS
ncbi:MAG TPA: cell division protein ZapD [Gammaproteobacteria bacterium]|nr:cell division protein ZapD [Gammaproteobacteria bacterium]